VNNLATHVAECKKKREVDSNENTNSDKESVPLSEQMNLWMSMELMASYLKAGELNPAHEPMQKGFL